MIDRRAHVGLGEGILAWVSTSRLCIGKDLSGHVGAQCARMGTASIDADDDSVHGLVPLLLQLSVHARAAVQPQPLVCLCVDHAVVEVTDGVDLGVTPKGAANTFNVELRPGPHSATVTCLDDGGDPLGSNIGTACIWIVIYGGEMIGGRELDIAYGGSETVGFEVPIQDEVPPFPGTIDGSTLQKLENQGP